MIKNERQYRITRAQAEKFERALARLGEGETESPSIHPLLRKAQEEALRGQLAEAGGRGGCGRRRGKRSPDGEPN